MTPAPAPLLGWDPLAPLAALVALAEAVPGVQRVWVGVPESIPNRVVAYVSAGGFETRVKNVGGISTVVLRYRVTFAYRVMGAEDDAETTMLGAALAYAAALEDDRTLGGTCNAADLDASVADAPPYVLVAGDEYRLYPTVVSVTMQRGFSPALSQ